MRAAARMLGLVLSGSVLVAAVGWLFGRLPLALFESGWPSWLLDVTFKPLDSVSNLAIGIAIGLLARRHALWIGAAAFCIGSLLFRVLDRLIFSPGVWPPIEPILLAHSLVTTAVSGAVLSLCGEYLRTWWTPARRAQLYSRLSSRAVAEVLVASTVYGAVAYLFTRVPKYLPVSEEPGLIVLTYSWLVNLYPIALGIFIGWCAKSDGVRVGAIAAGLGYVAGSVLRNIILMPYAPINPIEILHASAAAALLGGAYALVGEYARGRGSSNKRLERTRSEERAAQA